MAMVAGVTGAGAVPRAAADQDLRGRSRPARRPGELAHAGVPARQRHAVDRRGVRLRRRLCRRRDEHRHRRLGLLRRAHARARQPRHELRDRRSLSSRSWPRAATTGPTPGFYDPAFNDSHGTHVSGTVGASRDGVGETQPTGPVANMHGVAFNTDVYLGQHAQDGRRVLRHPAGDRDGRADAGQRLHRQRLPGRERRGDRERQADQAHHQQLGQPAATRRTTTRYDRRPAARRASA